MLRVRLGCERRFDIEFCGADSHFCHSALSNRLSHPNRTHNITQAQVAWE